MKRIRQIVIGLVGLFYVGLLYPLCTELWHSKWLLEMHDNECEPMFITFLVSLGVFLLLAVWKSSKYRIVVAFAAFQALVMQQPCSSSRLKRLFTKFHAVTTT